MSAEEKVRIRTKAAIRVVFATVFLILSGVVSIGANVTVALAKKGAPEQTREKRQKGATRRLTEQVRGKVHLRNYKALTGKRPAKVGNFKKVGKASWYGGKFHNRKTASGKRFDTYALMAAHKTLPFGTRLLVTNLSNHKTCVVEVADRGPYIGDRILDVSFAAATELGFVNKGVADVKIDVISEDQTPNYAERVTFIPVFDVTRGNVSMTIMEAAELAAQLEDNE